VASLILLREKQAKCLSEKHQLVAACDDKTLLCSHLFNFSFNFYVLRQFMQRMQKKLWHLAQTSVTKLVFS